MRDVFGGALLGAVLAVSVHLASLHSQTHHDAHHASSALHQALRRVVPARSQWLPFFAGCAPSQTCARNLVERPRSRLAGAPGDAAVAPPVDWVSAFVAGKLARAVASSRCAPGAAVGAGKARAVGKSPCAYEWRVDAFGRRLVDEDVACDIIPEPSAAFALSMVREAANGLRPSPHAPHVYWTVLDDSRAAAAAEVVHAFTSIARPSSQPAPSAFVVASVGAKAACAVHRAGGSAAAWAPPPAEDVHGRTDAAFMEGALSTGGLDALDINGRKRTFLGVRGTGGVAPELWRTPLDMLKYERSRRRRNATADTRLKHGARTARAASLRHMCMWRVALAFASTTHPKLWNARFLKTDADAFFAGSPPASLLMNLQEGLTCAVRHGIDPRGEHQRFVREAHVGGAPTSAVLAFKVGKAASDAARVFLAAAELLLADLDAATNRAAVHAAAHGDVLLGCAVAAATGNEWEAWGCGGKMGTAARDALRGADLDALGPLSLYLWDAETVVSHEHPAVLGGATVIVHVRSGDDDLTAAKDIRAGSRGGGLATTPYASVLRVAKELGVFGGAADEFGNRDYYRVDATKHRKYVAVEDTLIATMPPNFHNGERLGTACLSVLAIAYFTGRVAILPAALHFEKYYYLWEFVDVEGNDLRVHFRETHFLEKARGHSRRGVAAARIRLREDGTVATSRVMENDADDPSPVIYGRGDMDPMALLVAAATRSSISDADVLYVNADEVPTHNQLATPHRGCVFKPPWKAQGRGCSQRNNVPVWLGHLYDRTGWCTFEAHALRGLGLVTASDDCHAKRLEDARRVRLFDVDPGNRSLVVQKPRGGEAGHIG